MTNLILDRLWKHDLVLSRVWFGLVNHLEQCYQKRQHKPSYENVKYARNVDQIQWVLCRVLKIVKIISQCLSNSIRQKKSVTFALATVAHSDLSYHHLVFKWSRKPSSFNCSTARLSSSLKSESIGVAMPYPLESRLFPTFIVLHGLLSLR